MAFTGVRFALDKDTQSQYIVNFVHGRVTAVSAVGNHQDFAGKSITAIDDDLSVDENGQPERLAYKISFDGQGGFTNCVVGNVAAPNGPMPSQHRAPLAQSARDAYLQTGGNFNQNAQQPSSSPFDNIMDAMDGRKQQQQKPPANTNTRPVTQQPNNTQDQTSRRQPPPNRISRSQQMQVEALLKQYGSDLNQRVMDGRSDPIIGRADELNKLKQYLLRKKRSNVNLIGEAGVGKTAMFDALAQDIVNGNGEEELANARVISLDIQSMMAGSKFRGQFEERLLPILKGLEENGGYLNGQKVILCLDEIHSVLNAGKTEGSAGAAELMKPYLASDSLTCIGATTIEEYKKTVEKDPAMDRRFQPLIIDAPNDEDTLVILKGVAKAFESYHGLAKPFTDEQLQTAVKLTNRFLPTRNQPDKAIGVLDDAAAIARKEGRNTIKDLDIRHATSKAANMAAEFLEQDDLKRYETLEDDLNEIVRGQEPSMEKISDHLLADRMGLTDPEQPKGVFLIQGPTGVGKTFTPKILDKLINGESKDGKSKLKVIPMSQYQEKHDLSGLIGSSPGFVGYEDNNAELYEFVRDNPFGIVVLDEVEKAHKDIYDILLNIMQEGVVQDRQGRTVDFRNVTIVMTSNLGANDIQKVLDGGSSMGFDAPADTSAVVKAENDKIDSISKAAREKFFRPEFLNRVEMNGACLNFHHLSKDVVNRLVEDEVGKIGDRLRTNANGLELPNCDFKISKDVTELLKEQGYNKKLGARPMTSAAQRFLSKPLALWLAQNKEDILAKAAKSDKITLTVTKTGENKNDFKVSVKEITKKVKKKETAPAASKDVSNDNATKKKTLKRRRPAAPKKS